MKQVVLAYLCDCESNLRFSSVLVEDSVKRDVKTPSAFCWRSNFGFAKRGSFLFESAWQARGTMPLGSLRSGSRRGARNFERFRPPTTSTHASSQCKQRCCGIEILRETLDSRSQIEFALYLIKERKSMSTKRFIAQEQEINCGTAATQSVSANWFGRLSAEIVHRCRIALCAPTVQRLLAVERERRQIEREQMAEEYARGYLEGWHQCYSACL